MPQTEHIAKVPKSLEALFLKAFSRFIGWIKKKPTGEFTITILVNQGAIQGAPKVTVRDNL